MRVQLSMILVLVMVTNCQTMTTINHKKNKLPDTPHSSAGAVAELPIPKDDSLAKIAGDLHELAKNVKSDLDTFNRLQDDDQKALSTMVQLSTTQITSAIQQQGAQIAADILEHSGACIISTGAPASKDTTTNPSTAANKAEPSNELALASTDGTPNCSATTFNGDFIRNITAPAPTPTPTPTNSNNKMGAGIGIGIAVGAASVGIALSAFIIYKVYQAKKQKAGATRPTTVDAEILITDVVNSAREVSARSERLSPSPLAPASTAPGSSSRRSGTIAGQVPSPDQVIAQRSRAIAPIITDVVATDAPAAAAGDSPSRATDGFDPVVKPAPYNAAGFDSGRMNIFDEHGQIIGYQDAIPTDHLKEAPDPKTSPINLKDGRVIIPVDGQFHLPDGPVIRLEGDAAYHRLARVVPTADVHLRLPLALESDPKTQQVRSDLAASFKALETRWMILYGQEVEQKYAKMTK